MNGLDIYQSTVSTNVQHLGSKVLKSICCSYGHDSDMNPKNLNQFVSMGMIRHESKFFWFLRSGLVQVGLDSRS